MPSGVAPTIRMLSGLPDVVLTHVHGRLEGVERAQRRVTPEVPEASAATRSGRRDKRVIETGDARIVREARDCRASFLSLSLPRPSFEDRISPRADVIGRTVGAVCKLPGFRDGRKSRAEKSRVGDGLNRRDTRRGIPREINARARADETRRHRATRIPRCRRYFARFKADGLSQQTASRTKSYQRC